MEIKKVSIIGQGALGILFGHQMRKHMPKEDLRFIADESRIARYQKESVYCNGERCDFEYVSPDKQCEPADLLLFAVKYNALRDAVAAAKNHVGPNTIILSPAQRYLQRRYYRRDLRHGAHTVLRGAGHGRGERGQCADLPQHGSAKLWQRGERRCLGKGEGYR